MPGTPGTVTRRGVAVVAVVAVAVALLAAPAAAQGPARSLEHACPANTPGSGFADLHGNAHAAAVDCLALYGITAGVTPAAYQPAGSVRRDQMASFVMRLLDLADLDLPAAGEGTFTDVSPDNPHATAINRLAAIGVVGGFADGSYQPAAPVRRDQMTAFLNRSVAEIAGEPWQTDQRFFTDIAGNVHEDDINALASARVAVGTVDGTFLPAQPVRRDQMAAFVLRLVDVLIEEAVLFTSVHVATLDGYMVVDDGEPPARLGQGDPGALGTAFLRLHSGTGRLCSTISVLADGPFHASHLVSAAMDAAGSTVAQLGAPDDETGRTHGCVPVETALLDAIEASPSDFAVDVRSQRYPRGVARGQLDTAHRAVTPSGAFVADDESTPVRFGQGQTDASGVAVLQIDAPNGRLCTYLATDAAGPYIGAHIHAGAMDATGPRVLDLPVPADATGQADGCVSGNPLVMAELVERSAGHYVTVRSAEHPEGAVRSQLATGTLGVPLSGALVVGPEGQPAAGEPGATGHAWLQADFASGFTCFWVTTDATGPFTTSHIVRAPAGERGPAVVSAPAPRDTTGEVSRCQQIDPAVLADTQYVDRYAFVVRTAAYPDGAVRGQLADGLLYPAVSPGG